MKKYVFIGVLLLAAGSILSSCRDQDEIYREFITVGGKKYPQTTENAGGKTGYYKALLTWLKPIDPSVAKTVVTWYEGVDKKSVLIEGSSYPVSVADTVGLFIENLDEADYTFYLYTEDSEGNRSIQRDVSVTVRGDVFLESLSDRTIESTQVDGEGNCIITWGAKTSNLSYTEVRYRSTSGEKVVQTRVSTTTTILPDYDFAAAEPFSYRSVFANDLWCENFFKPWVQGESFKR
ncbi:MAG: hypothetical protein IJL56_04630 [Bacteroidales bacterium]|nr:hypothetical protein [Bacteroidales bacterium]